MMLGVASFYPQSLSNAFFLLTLIILVPPPLRPGDTAQNHPLLLLHPRPSPSPRSFSLSFHSRRCSPIATGCRSRGGFPAASTLSSLRLSLFLFARSSFFWTPRIPHSSSLLFTPTPTVIPALLLGTRKGCGAPRLCSSLDSLL